MIKNYSVYTNHALRLLLGITFVLHGKFKLVWGYSNLSDWLQSQGFPFSELFGYVLPWIEVVGGLFIIAGVGTRLCSFLFAGILLIALLKVKIGSGFISSTDTGYEFDLLLLIVSLHVAVSSPNGMKEVWNNLKGGERRRD